MPPSEYYGNEEASGLRVVSLLLKQKLDTLPKLAVFTLSLLVLVKTVSLVYSYFTSPVYNVPGPLLNRLSYWPLRLATISGKRIYYVDKLHKRYGPCVVLSPEEVAISEVASAKEIHRIGGNFVKAPWYGKFAQEDFAEVDKGIFSMRDPKVHAARRKLFANAFSKNAICDWEDVLQEKVQMAMNGIKRELASNGKANILAWFTYMANDVIATLSFGKSFGSLEKGEKTQFIKDLESVMMLSGITVELPWLSPVTSLLQPNKRLRAAGKAALAESRLEGSGEKVDRTTIFAKMVAAGDADTLNIEQIEREASNFVVAGSDTTAVTLTYLVYAVMTADSAVRQRLLDEVSNLKDGFTAQEAAGLPFLSLVMQETLRLYGAAPGALPRSVPAGGRFLGGHFIREGVTVSTQAYTLHRDATVFPEPLKFWPQRWESPSQAMKDAYMPFGGGTRICIGMHLATLELALGAASFFRNFRTAKPASETDESSMSFENYFLIAPVSHTCMIML